jgi:pyridoxal phosphate enzyme (YggS family)
MTKRMSIKENLLRIKSNLPKEVTLIAVTKTHPVEKLMELYNAGHYVFGENKVQEMCDKYEKMPKNISWHLIGHLQTNKVKYIAPFVSLIHSVDSLKLLKEINKQAAIHDTRIHCLLQIYIASEETKFGLSFEEAEQLLNSEELKQLKYVSIVGLMGMASNTEDKELIRKEFRSLSDFYKKHRLQLTFNWIDRDSSKKEYSVLSMGMSSDYNIAIEEGSTMIRVGSSIFGNRDYK